MNHFISLTEAIAMTSAYREQYEKLLKPEYQGQNILPLSETFDKSAFETLMNQAGCTGLRIYYGMDETYKVHAIVVGVDAENRDLLPSSSSSLTAEEEDLILERAMRCPDICPDVSPLNS